jgi:stress-induced morphogen
MAKMEERLSAKLTSELTPLHLELVNESPNHGLPLEAEKHFRVVIVSDKFLKLSRIDRHRLVHAAVSLELKEHVHALSVQAFTKAEWQGKGGETFASPECLGGGKRERVGRD